MSGAGFGNNREMSSPQVGILALGTRAHYYLEFDLLPGTEPRLLVEALASLREPRVATGGLNFVVGFGPELWRHVAPDDCPQGVHRFETISGPDGFMMPAAQHDAWVWIAGASRDGVFDAAMVTVAALADVAELGDDSEGFAYHDSRDLSGFIDGTANVGIDEAAAVVAVANGESGAGSSVVLVQRWIHDLETLHALPVSDQEAVFGRTKEHGVQFEDEVMPADAHIARVEIHDGQGEELPIFRRSTPIGGVRDHGLEFVAFTRDQSIIDLMLERMVGVGDGVRDRLTRFSMPVTGAFYVAPSVEALRRFAIDEG